MVFQERSPGLRRRIPTAHHVFAHTGLADVDAQLAEFAMDARSARPKADYRGSSAESVCGSPSALQGVRVARGGPSKSRTGGILCGARQSPYPVSRCRVPSATRSMFHKTRTTSSGRTGSVSASSRSVAKRQADGEARGSQAAMPLEFGKAAALQQAMPITRL